MGEKQNTVYIIISTKLSHHDYFDTIIVVGHRFYFFKSI